MDGNDSRVKKSLGGNESRVKKTNVEAETNSRTCSFISQLWIGGASYLTAI